MTEPEKAPNLVRNVPAEALLLGGIMCENSLIERVLDIVEPDDFYEPLHGRIFSVIQREHALGRAVNPVTIKPYFEDDPTLKELGGQGYLAKLTGDGVAPLGAISAAGQVAEMARRRRLIAGLQIAVDLAQDMNATSEEVVAAADAAIVPDEGTSSGIVQKSAGDAFWEMIEEAENNDPGITAPELPGITEAMGPLRKHDLAVLAGRPGMGKTCVAMSYALSAARAGHGVLFVSLEMSRVQLMQRAAADMLFDGMSGIPYSAIRDNTLYDGSRRRLHELGRAFREMPLHIIDAGSLTIGRLNMIVRRYKRRMEAKGTPLQLVVVDYLQLVNPDMQTSNPVDRVSQVSRGLKSIAKTYDLAVLALAQLNRGVEQRENKKPMLSDLRESGQIEQDADKVLFLYRDYYYLKKAGPGTKGEQEWQDILALCEHDIEFICAKRRDGEERSVTGQFYGAYQAVRG